MFKNMFKKSNLPVVSVSFWLIIFFALYSILNIAFQNRYNLSLKNYFSVVEPISVNLELEKKVNPSSFFVCYDDKCVTFDNAITSKVYTSRFNFGYDGVEELGIDLGEENKYGEKIKNIYIAYPTKDQNFKKNIKALDVHVGNKKHYLTSDDVLNLKDKTIKMELNSPFSKKTYQEYNVMKVYDKGNYLGLFNNICILFLSLFYNWQLFIIPYFWIFVAILIYLFNKDEIKIDKFINKIKGFINEKPLCVLTFIILLGVVLRLNGFNYYPLWNDEVYTKTVALKDLLHCFSDPGNPPLFFVLEYIFTRFFGLSETALRVIPFIFGVGIIPLIYVVFKNINRNLALFASFLMAINTISFYYSTEARGYSLFMVLAIASMVLLFNYLKAPDFKKLIYYFLITACMVNSYYYLILISIGNFIWGIVDLIQNNNKKHILPFFTANLLAALSFLPYLIINYNISVKTTFNAWIQPLTSDTFIYIIKEFFINKYVFLFLCLVLLFNLILLFVKKEALEKINIKINPNKETLLVYLVYSFTLFLIMASAISLGIKPIVHKRLLMSFYSLFFVLEMVIISGVFEFIKQNKFTKIFKLLYFVILLAVFFSITKPMPVKYFCRLDNFMYFMEKDSKRYLDEGYDVWAVSCDSYDYLDNYPDIKKLDYINWNIANVNQGRNIVDLKKYFLLNDVVDKNRKAVIYSHGIAVYIYSAIKNNPDMDVFYNNSTETVRLIYNPKKGIK